MNDLKKKMLKILKGRKTKISISELAQKLGCSMGAIFSCLKSMPEIERSYIVVNGECQTLLQLKA